MKRDTYEPYSVVSAERPPTEAAYPISKKDLSVVASSKLLATEGLQKPSDNKLCPADAGRFVVIDGRRLERECLSRSIGMVHPEIALIGCDSIDGCLNSIPFSPSPDAIILRIEQNDLSDPETYSSIGRLVEGVAPIPVVVLSDSEDLAQMLAILDCGVSGCVPANIGLESIVEAMKLAAAGGILLTPDGLRTIRQMIQTAALEPDNGSDELTSRQAAVAEALRRGKANKLIAYELNMCESTVKVHVRNILKKLKVTNRTEAAYKLNSIR